MSYHYYQPQRRTNYYGMPSYQPTEHPMLYGNGSYYAYPHPALESEYQRSRPAKLSPRVLNRRFKKVTIQLNENRVLLISVVVAKGNKPCLVFSQCEGSYENRTNTVSIPEVLVVPFIQQLHKLSKWRPSTSGNLPASQGLSHDDTVFRMQVICQTEPDAAAESRLYAIKIVAEARARDPIDRKELASVCIPLDSSHLMKVKEALNDVIVASAESPLYFTKSLQCADGSKFYLDMIRDSEAHYLKVSQVTREYRSILHVPAEDLDAFKELLENSLRAMKGHLEEHKTGGGAATAGAASAGGASSKKRRARQNRQRRRKRSTDGKAGDADGEADGDGADSGKENSKPKSDSKSADCDHVGAEDKKKVAESKAEEDRPRGESDSSKTPECKVDEPACGSGNNDAGASAATGEAAPATEN